MTADRRRQGRFFLVDLGPGTAVGGMRLEIYTGFSCYLTAARRRRGRFFSLVNLGPGAAVEGIRIEINTGYSCYLTAAGRGWPFALSISDPDTLLTYSALYHFHFRRRPHERAFVILFLILTS